MKKKVINNFSEDVVSVGKIHNGSSIGFVRPNGQAKGYIGRIKYVEYQPMEISATTYYAKVSPDKEEATRSLIDMGYEVFQFSSDPELKVWLLS